MPSRKKKSKAKGRKPAVGKGGAKKAADNVTAKEVKQGTLDSEMQRLKIGEQKGDEDDVEAMLEQAIKLAAVEQQEIEKYKKENCTHGYNPSSRFHARFCEVFLKTFMESYRAATRHGHGDNIFHDRLDGLKEGFVVTRMKYSKELNVVTNLERIISYSLAEGTKLFLDGKSDDARLCAVLASYTERAKAGELPDIQKMLELLDVDEHTLVQFFRKQIPCSCLDEKYKEVKFITKMGICYSPYCPLPGRRAVRSKMFQCTGCPSGHNVSYCSRECQEADWPAHKVVCGKTIEEVQAHLKK